MKRRELLTTIVASGLAVPALAAQDDTTTSRSSGPLANATVSFGAWPPADGRPSSGNRFAVPNAVHGAECPCAVPVRSHHQGWRHA